MLAIPAAWVAGEHKLGHWQTLIAARAIENTAYVLAAAQPGPTYTGHSAIVDPFGVVLGALGDTDGGDDPALLTAELRAVRVEEARAAAPGPRGPALRLRPGRDPRAPVNQSGC